MRKKISWKNLKTVNSYAADEVISALQKEIRRGNVEKAIFWANELCISGSRYQKKFWERVTTIAVEDIGLANPMACVVVNSLKTAFYSHFEKKDDSLIQALFAVGYLAKSKKDRFIDEYKNYLQGEPRLLKIPDYALDKHTKRGRELGRGDEHFWKIAANIKPEMVNRNKKYLKKILKAFRGSRVNK